MRALVTDDSRTMRTILVRILAQLGFEADQAEDGRAAWSRLQEGNPPELMLVDWHMPELTGAELVALVRADSRFDSVRIMMVSSEGDPAFVSEALAAGADEYIVKPFDAGAIAEKLALLNLGGAAFDAKVSMEWSLG
ncbi:MAG: response regulator [Actinomycetota bacterium]|nr:response regulator [Actinomycetota bacterium]